MWRTTPNSSEIRCRQHVAREARDLQRLAAGVALHDRGDLGGIGAIRSSCAETQHACSPGISPSAMSASFFWISWFRGERPAELLAIEHVLRVRAMQQYRPRRARPRRFRSAPRSGR